MMQNALYFTLKLILFLTYLSFCHEIFAHIRKRLDKKANFKNYDVIHSETNNYNTHIAQYLKKRRQLGNEIWSLNRI